MPRVQYEVRVREGGQKKSRFYEAQSSQDAARKYHGPGFVMWAKKASKTRILGVGDFFKLGDRLMAEFKGIPVPEEEEEEIGVSWETTNKRRRGREVGKRYRLEVEDA